MKKKMLPYFLSWAVVAIILSAFLDRDYGLVNRIMMALGKQSGKVDYYTNRALWPPLLVAINAWKGVGYTAIVYVASISGISQEYYEAAVLDGASKLRRIFSIDIPYIAPTILTLFILNTGSILSIGFEKIYLMQNSINSPVSEVISTYVYKMGVLNGNFSFSTAVGLFNSLVNLFMLLVVNTISKKLSNVSVL